MGGAKYRTTIDRFKPVGERLGRNSLASMKSSLSIFQRFLFLVEGFWRCSLRKIKTNKIYIKKANI